MSASILLRENDIDQSAGVTAGDSGHGLLAVLSQLLGELANQRVVGGIVNVNLARGQIDGQRSGIAFQFAARIAGDGVDLSFRGLDNLLLVFFRGLPNARFFGGSFTLGRGANLARLR